MKLLAEHRVLALGAMAQRPLARYLASLGATIVHGTTASGSLATLADCDFLLDDLGLERLADQGWTRAAIERVQPRLVHVSVTCFGSGGPRARWLGSELVASALGGTLRLTGQMDRPPVKEALDACTFHADMVAATGAMAAHYARGAHGAGQHVDVSIQEVAFSRNVNSLLVWQFDRRKLQRVGGALNYGRATVRCIWALADGWCFHSLMTGRFGAPANQGLSDWIDTVGMPNPLRGTDWLNYNRSTLDPGVRTQWEAAMAAFFATRTRAEVSSEGRRRGINACVVNEPGDVLGDPHLAARGFFEAEAGLRRPSRFALLRPGPAETTRSGPVPRHSGARPGPLAGVRVLDFSWALVGSITTKILGDLGADVIKVESRTRPCLSRLDVQVAASRAGHLDDKPWFAHLNTSKRSLALDLRQPAARTVLDPLLDWADVVVENFSPGTMARLGLDYDRLAARNPALVMVSGSVFGQSGPLAHEWGVDGTGAALSGRTYLTGWPDRDPVIPGAVPYGDVIVPYVMAATVAAALQYRAHSGRGLHIDCSMYEICVQQMTAAILAAQTGPPPRRTGNTEPDRLLQDVFPAQGEDRWVAITVTDQAQLDRLHALAGGTDISRWTRQRPDHALMAELQAAGIAAGVVQDIEDLLDRDPQLATRGALVELDHPLLGPFGHLRTALHFSRDRFAVFRAPGIGEHSLEVAREVASLAAAELDQLMQAGVFE